MFDSLHISRSQKKHAMQMLINSKQICVRLPLKAYRQTDLEQHVTAEAEVFLNLSTITHLHLLPATKERWEASVPAVIQSHYTALFSLHCDEISELIMEIQLVQLISLNSTD